LATVLGCSAGGSDNPTAEAGIPGPYARLLSTSTDLGPSSRPNAQLTVELDGSPGRLERWATQRALRVRSDEGEHWAVVSGPAADLGTAFGVTIDEYSREDIGAFYAAAAAPVIPRALRGTVVGAGRILGYSPHHTANPPPAPREVPDNSLSPAAVDRSYNLTPLSAAGFTGSGESIAVFALSGYRQSDLDTFSDDYRLPRFTPGVIGGPLAERASAETTMDLEIAHAVAPNARLLVVNARPSTEGDGTYVKIADLMRQVDREAPGAVWSLSIGWGCDKLVTEADLAPVRSALAAAHLNGTVTFDASGDLAGFECRDGQQWSTPQGPDDVGLDSVAALPEVTSVGGTSLSTGADGGWLAERAWFSSVLTLGSGGGRSNVFSRPAWQLSALPVSAAPQRLTPDVAAVADNTTGVGIVLDGKPTTGGGTSQAAPLWAGAAAVLNQYLLANGGHRLGDLNPMLYRIAEGSQAPAFHDITVGGNGVASATAGYDMVTGLGSPDFANLARDVLDLQRSLR
jgi:kumamolisin